MELTRDIDWVIKNLKLASLGTKEKAKCSCSKNVTIK